MDFFPYEPPDTNKAQRAVWQLVKATFKDAPGVGFYCYHIFNSKGDFAREIDILILHRELGLWVIECKGCYISNIETINGSEWRMKNWLGGKDKETPILQASNQMFAIKNHLRKHLDFCHLLAFSFRVAVPFIHTEDWQARGYHERPNTQGVVLTSQDLTPEIFKYKLTGGAKSKQRKLSDKKWETLLETLCDARHPNSENELIIPTTKSTFQAKEMLQIKESVVIFKVSENTDIPGKIEDNTKVIFNHLIESRESQKIAVSLDSNEVFIKINGCNDNKLEALIEEEEGQKYYTEDSIRLYLEEIAQIPLLRGHEEIELARKVTDLLELERVRQQLYEQSAHQPQDKEWATAVNMTLPAFLHRLYVGRRAKDKMVRSNLRLVVSIAKKYMNRGLSFQDLIQEGSLGLIHAAEKFDHEKGYKFSTYATGWIQQAIIRAIVDQSRTIRLPVHVYETISRIQETTKLLSKQMGRKPRQEEIATGMEMTIEKLRFIASIFQLPISLDAPIAQDGSCLGDFLEDNSQTPEDHVSRNLLREDIESILDTLSLSERDVIRLRYGLDDGRMKTLKEISQVFNTSPERIRQVEAKALRKLRHPFRNSILQDYLRGHNCYDCREQAHEQQTEQSQSYIEETRNYDIEPQNAATYLEQGVVCFKGGDTGGAIENFTQVLKIEPNNAQVYYYRGLSKAERQDYRGAIEDFTQAIVINPQFIDAYYQRGYVCYSLGDNQEAIKDFNWVLSLNPNETSAYLYLGFVQVNLGKIYQAISYYNQAIKIEPNYAEAYFHRGVALYRLGKLHEAVNDYTQALQIYSDFSEAYSHRGLALHKLGDYQGALENYSYALHINCEDYLTYYYRGLLYQIFTDYVNAIEDFNQALRLNPNFIDAYYDRAIIHYNRRNYQEALKDLNQVVRINPKDAQAYNKRSSVRAALGDYQGASEDLQKVIQIQDAAGED